MGIQGLPLVPGKARGFVEIDPLRDATVGGSGRPIVLALPAATWSETAATPTGAVGYLVEGDATVARARRDVPAVGGIDRDLLRPGEEAELDGSSGLVRLEGTREQEVVTAFLQRPDGRILVLRRSGRVGSFRGRWAGVSGFLEDPTPLDQALREVGEETGIRLSRADLLRAGAPVYARDGPTVYVVHPFRFRTSGEDVRLDWEHEESRWVDPQELGRLDTVPKLARAWSQVAGPASGGKTNPRA